MKALMVKGELIPAMLSHAKTQTYRILYPLVAINDQPDEWECLCVAIDGRLYFRHVGQLLEKPLIIRPPYRPGETCFVPEAHHGYIDENDEWSVTYKADWVLAPDETHFTWRSPYWMKAVQARLFVHIDKVWAQRILTVTPEQVYAEGLAPCRLTDYLALWDCLNPAYPSERNPWVIGTSCHYVDRPEGI